MNTVVFDLGGVLIDWDPRYLLRDVMPGREDEMEAILATALNHDWNLARDAGDSWPDAMAELEARHPQWADIFRTFDARWGETLGGANEPTLQVLSELRERGTPLYALSNWSAEKFPEAEARFEWLGWFEGIVVSGRVKMVKPDEAIFRYLLETHELDPDDLFFIDDLRANVEGAASVGIHGHHFRDAALLRQELQEQQLLD